tara:strand:+ start:14538 stop:14672 length:135 start_codon:yes stop_codon:yes gene_type:complete
MMGWVIIPKYNQKTVFMLFFSKLLWVVEEFIISVTPQEPAYRYF